MGIVAQHPSIDTVRINLENFKRVMNTSRAPTDEEMVAQQKSMLGTLKTIFRQDGDVFHKCMDIFLAWVRENIDGCMKPNARYRGMHKAKEISKQDHNALLFLVGLACMISNGNARQLVLARIDFGRLDKFWPTGNASDKLRSYFNV